MGFDWTIWSKVIIQTIFNDHGSPTWFWLVLTRINLRLIKCDFLLDFILFHLKKKSIPNQLEFWAASYGQNKKHVQKITQIQHHLQFSFKISYGDQHQICSSLSNRLILSHCFRTKFFFFLKNKLDRETNTSCEKIKKCSKNVIIFSSNLKRIFGPKKVEI